MAPLLTALLQQDYEIVKTFGNTEEALDALNTGAALTDLSHWTRLQVTGRDRLTFLHSQVQNEAQTTTSAA